MRESRIRNRRARRADVGTTELLYEHMRQLWEDQVEYAETLRNQRKLFGGALLAFVSLGVFQIRWWVPADSQPVPLSPESAILTKYLVSVGVVLSFLAARAMFSSNPFYVGLWLLIRPVVSVLFGALIWYVHWQVSDRPYWRVKVRSPERARASALLEFDPLEWDLVINASPGVLWQIRADKYESAYGELVLRNEAVSRANRRAGFWVLWAFTAIFAAFLVYTWGEAGVTSR